MCGGRGGDSIFHSCAGVARLVTLFFSSFFHTNTHKTPRSSASQFTASQFILLSHKLFEGASGKVELLGGGEERWAAAV